MKFFNHILWEKIFKWKIIAHKGQGFWGEDGTYVGPQVNYITF
jgi:hypothetical protein